MISSCFILLQLVKFSNDSVRTMASVAGGGTFIFYFSYFPQPPDFTHLSD